MSVPKHLTLAEYTDAVFGFLEERAFLSLVRTLNRAGHGDDVARTMVRAAFADARQDFDAVADVVIIAGPSEDGGGTGAG